MPGLFSRAIDGADKSVDERRLMAMVVLILMIIVVIGTLGLGYLVAFIDHERNSYVIQGMGMLLYLVAILGIFCMLMAGIVTWQNVTDTLKSVPGLPGQIGDAVSKIESEQSKLTITPEHHE